MLNYLGEFWTLGRSPHQWTIFAVADSRKRVRKRPADINRLAASIVQDAVSEATEDADPRGRAGGIVGGRARADKLTSEQRREIAKKAARARWNR